jgi:chromosome segregation protein
LESLIKERSEGLSTYQARIDDLEKSTEEAAAKLDPLQQTVEQENKTLEETRALREQKTHTLGQQDEAVRRKRKEHDVLQQETSQLDVKLAEQRMRHQNQVDRLITDYRLAPEEIDQQDEPEWEDGVVPDRETRETMIAEIRTKLESMGPVNLVAIEEHKELEERYQFLVQQQDDLVKAKQQLMDLIRKINKTTTELFSQTFDAVNINFQDMFKRLFGGGSAKLVLVDEENVLDSGIEIIARPPGKKLQSVSLLSGGERTLTAVALLFALYLVKPSPFCVLDELDAALDDTNIGRFVDLVKSFVEGSQFIVITHNRMTISAADVLYGVTMEKHGISKIVSVKFADHEGDMTKAERSVADSVR